MLLKHLQEVSWIHHLGNIVVIFQCWSNRQKDVASGLKADRFPDLSAVFWENKCISLCVAGVEYLERITLCSTPLWRTDCVCWWSWTTICWRRSATTAATGDRYDKPYDWFTVLTNTVKHLFSSVEHKKQTWLITSMKIFTVFYVSGFKRCFTDSRWRPAAWRSTCPWIRRFGWRLKTTEGWEETRPVTASSLVSCCTLTDRQEKTSSLPSYWGFL